MKKVPFVTLEKLNEITEKYPTPFHLYDEKGIRENAKALKEAFAWNKGFKEFFEKPDVDVLKGEYLLPIYIDELLQKGEVTVKVLETQDKWFGVTYKEDKDSVVESFKKLIEEGVYKEKLFDDIL